MRLIMLSGLVTVEKIDLAVELAEHYTKQRQSVTVIDNGQRLSIHERDLDAASFIRLEDDLSESLLPALDSITSDVTVLVATETAQPDALFTLLDEVRQARPELEVQTLALIDTRTCDCFPQFRLALEDYADVTVNLPAEVGEVVEALK
jgi:hypothetical protein